jgi:hypothetical protein
LVVIVGLMGALAWVRTTDFGDNFGAWLWLAGLPLVWDLSRTLHEALVPTGVVADARGLELSWSERVPWRPWMRRRTAAVPWDRLEGVRLHTVSINGVATSSLMIDRTDALTLSFEHGTFAQPASTVQAAILDERDDRLLAPRRLELDVAGYCRDRWTTPRTFVRLHPRRAEWIMLAVALAWGGVAFWASMTTGGLVMVAVLGVPPLLLGIVAIAMLTTDSVAALRFEADGVARGPSSELLVAIPWSRIRFARPNSVNGVVVTVRVAVADAADLLLGGSWVEVGDGSNRPVTLAALAAMLSPTLDEVTRERQSPTTSAPG